MTNFKMWWKRFWHDHHWHVVDNTFRKVKSPHLPICENWTHEDKKYIRPGLSGLREIVVKCIRHCCVCNKKEIKIQYVMVMLSDDKCRALSYPDLDDSPLLPECIKKDNK